MKHAETKQFLAVLGFILSVLLFGAQGAAYAEEVALCAEDAFVPFSEANGTGLSNDIVVAAYKAVGVDAKIKVYPFTRLMVMVKDGSAIGGFNAVPTSDTKADYLFGKSPIYVTHMYFYYNSQSPIVIDTEADIMAKLVKPKVVVGDVAGYIYPPAYTALTTSKDPNKSLKEESVDSDEILIKKLQAQRNKIALMTAEVADYHINRMGLQKAFGHGKYVWDAPLYIAFSKKNPKSKHFMELFDKGMETIKANGTYDKILLKYPFLKK